MPQSTADLAELTGRRSPNVTRTLGKLEAAGFVRIKSFKGRKVHLASVWALQVST